MQINVIHNPESKERGEKLQKVIDEYNLDVKYWPAIYDKEMPFRGICKAHKQIIQYAKDKGLGSVCIAEDDFYFTSKQSWKYFLENIPMDYDVYLSGIYCGTIKEDNTSQDFCGLHLYIVHEKFYDRFLSVPNENNIDRQLGRIGRAVVSYPFISLQYNNAWSEHKSMICPYYDYLVNRPILLDNGEKTFVYYMEKEVQMKIDEATNLIQYASKLLEEAKERTNNAFLKTVLDKKIENLKKEI